MAHETSTTVVLLAELSAAAGRIAAALEASNALARRSVAAAELANDLAALKATADRPPPPVPCPHCGGTGKIAAGLWCQDCAGTGAIDPARK